jgi:LysM repeat protein
MGASGSVELGGSRTVRFDSDLRLGSHCGTLGGAMKRNEKFLVYAVTGFLAVILVIAIVFGNDDLEGRTGPVPEPEKETPTASRPGIAGLNEILFGGGKPLAPGTAVGDPEPADPTGEEPGAGEGPGTGEEPAAEPGVGEVALDVEAPAPVTTSGQVAVELGPSRRDRDYRVVRVRSGDSFRQLVQKWCGSLDYLDRARKLNETVEVLQPGQEVSFPWVDDDVILAAHRARQEAAARPSPAAAAEPLAGENSRVYTVVSGDSIWAIAVRAVGNAGAPDYIKLIKDLNPQIADVDKLKVGQKILLPVGS